MVRPARFELTTYGLGIRRSILLSHGRNTYIYEKTFTFLKFKFSKQGKSLLLSCNNDDLYHDILVDVKISSTRSN